MTEPRDRAPDEPLDSTDEPPLDQTIDDDIDAAGAEGETIDDADVDEIESELLDETEAEAVETEQAAIDDYEAALREVAGEDVPVAAAAAEPRSPGRHRTEGKAPSRAPSPSEIAVHVREDWSKVFVMAAVAVFVVILLNGMLLGTGGLLRPLATPTPSATASPSPSTSASASPSAASPSAASPSADPAASPSAS